MLRHKSSDVFFQIRPKFRRKNQCCPKNGKMLTFIFIFWQNITIFHKMGPNLLKYNKSVAGHYVRAWCVPIINNF